MFFSPGLAAVRVGAKSLDLYFDNYPKVYRDFIGKAKGFDRELALRILNAKVFDEEHFITDPSSFRIVKYYDDYRPSDWFLHKAVELLHKESARELFGLTLTDVLSMDYALFEEITTIVDAIEKKRVGEESHLFKDTH